MTIVVIAKDDKIVNVYVAYLADLFSKNIINHTLEDSRYIFQPKREAEKLYMVSHCFM